MTGKDDFLPYGPSSLLDLAVYEPRQTKHFWMPGKIIDFHPENSEIGHTVAFGSITKAMSIIDAEQGLPSFFVFQGDK